MNDITLEKHNGINVLRDDLLPGGTKSIFLDKILDPSKDIYVYASPVYGGFQIALAKYATSVGKQAVIFCAKRGTMHQNTLKVIEAGGWVNEVPHGYLNVVQSAAQKFQYEYTEEEVQLIKFGADYPEAINAIAERMRNVTDKLGFEPKHIFCAGGSGTLAKGIYKGTNTSYINVVQVGQDLSDIFQERSDPYKFPRLNLFIYHKSFDKVSLYKAPFPSMPNYDLKAWEYCEKIIKDKTYENVLFWNVL